MPMRKFFGRKANNSIDNNKENDKTSSCAVWQRIGFKTYIVIVVLVAIISGAWGSYSWYKANREAGETHTQIISDSIDMAIDHYSFYKVDESTKELDVDGKTVIYTGFKTTSDVDNHYIEYDSVFQRNSFTPIYLCVVLSGERFESGEKPSLSVRFLRTGTSLNGNTTDANGLEYITGDNIGKISEFESNILTISSTQGSASLNAQTDPNVIYPALNASSTVWSSEQSFFSGLPVARGRKTVLTDTGLSTGTPLTKSDTAEVLLTSNDYTVTDGKAYLYFKLDYHQALVECYVNKQFGTVIRLGGEQTVNTEFDGDISSIVISPNNS